MLKAGWVRELADRTFELGPSCGLVLSIVALRESTKCAVARPDGRLVPRDSSPEILFESTDIPLMPRDVMSEDEIYAGADPATFTSKLATLVKRCLKHRRAASEVGFSAVCIAWPGRIDRFAREIDGKPLGDVHSYEQKTFGGWTYDEDQAVSLAGLVDSALGRAGFTKRRPPILVVNDADAELLALAHIPLEERSPTKEELEEGDGPAVRAAEVHDRIDAAKIAMGVTIAGGVGGALLVGGELARGQRGFVGELGEVPVDIGHDNVEKGKKARLKTLEWLDNSSKFPRWACPHERTLDYWASGRSIIDQLILAERTESKYLSKETYTQEIPVAGDATDSEVSGATLKRAGRLIGLGLIGPVLMLDPGVIVVSSPLPSDPIAEGIKDMLNNEIEEVNPAPNIVLAVEHDSSRLLKGAARWAIQEIIDPALETMCAERHDGLAKHTLPQWAWPPA